MSEPDNMAAEYRLYGSARGGGPYNGHFLFGLIVGGLAAGGVIPAWFGAWLLACLIAAFFIDRRSFSRKLAFRSLPGQTGLFLQVAVGAARDALPLYLSAFLLYLLVAPVWLTANVAVNSFIMLYAFFLVSRFGILVFLLVKSSPKMFRHIWWAFFLGNAGITARCCTQVAVITAFEFLRQYIGADLTAHSALGNYLIPLCGIGSLVFIVTGRSRIRRALFVYYKIHRTVHANRALYEGIHGIHHRAAVPTLLDSGTISPLEFFLMEMAMPGLALLPNWIWALAQAGLSVYCHWPSHDAENRDEFYRHHLDHHRFSSVNFGLLPWDDARFGTLRRPYDVFFDGTWRSRLLQRYQ